MLFSQEIMNDRLIEKWMDLHSNLTETQKSILLHLKKDLRDNWDVLKNSGMIDELSFFYDMNKMIILGGGQLSVEECGITFECINNVILLTTTYGNIEMNADDFKNIVGAFIDIYQELYPIGTVVDLDKKYFRKIYDIDEIDNIRVVISHRFVPYNKNIFIPYMGMHYPFGPLGVENDGVHFTPRVIKNVVHMGYRDEKETAYLFKIKEKLIVENNMKSSAMMMDRNILDKILQK